MGRFRATRSACLGGVLAIFAVACGGGGDDEPQTASAGDASVEADPSWLASAHVTLSADALDGIVADGEQMTTVTLTVADGTGKLRAGVVPEFKVTGSDNIVSAPAPTDAFGATQITLRSTKAEAKTITPSITQDGVSVTDLPQRRVIFVAGPPDQNHSHVVADHATASANGTDRITFNVTLLDAHDNPVVNTPVALIAETRTVGVDVTSEIGTASPFMTSAKALSSFVEVRTLGASGRFVGGAEVSFQ